MGIATQHVVVTGASAGVGRAVARAFAERGATVGLMARGRAGLKAAAKDVESLGGTPVVLPADVADWDQVRLAAERFRDEAGALDVWINVAMATVFSWFSDMDPADFRRATEVTYLGQVHGCLAALRSMEPADQGTIVNVGSALAFRGIPLQAPYCGAKFAVRGFTESLRAELLAKDSNVHVATVHLPAVNTPQFEWGKCNMPNHPQPVPPIYQPEVAASAIVEVVDERKAEVTIGSVNRGIVAATKLFPRVLDHYTARSAVSDQQLDVPVDPDRRHNLDHPVDDDEDFGAHGRFDSQAGGATTASFLKGIPGMARDVVGAFRDRWQARREASDGG